MPGVIFSEGPPHWLQTHIHSSLAILTIGLIAETKLREELRSGKGESCKLQRNHRTQKERRYCWERMDGLAGKGVNITSLSRGLLPLLYLYDYDCNYWLTFWFLMEEWNSFSTARDFLTGLYYVSTPKDKSILYANAPSGGNWQWKQFVLS